MDPSGCRSARRTQADAPGSPNQNSRLITFLVSTLYNKPTRHQTGAVECLLHGADSPPIKTPEIPQTASKVMVWNGPSNRHQKCLTWSRREAPQRKDRSMEKIITVGLDLAKSIFQVHGTAEKPESLGSSHIAAMAGSTLLSEPSNLLGRYGGLCECPSLGARDSGAGPLCPHDAASLREALRQT
ncbi:hypothetical protein ACVW0J_009239 [Bradyrhizobium sp. i1.7.7]